MVQEKTHCQWKRGRGNFASASASASNSWRGLARAVCHHCQPSGTGTGQCSALLRLPPPRTRKPLAPSSKQMQLSCIFGPWVGTESVADWGVGGLTSLVGYYRKDQGASRTVVTASQQGIGTWLGGSHEHLAVNLALLGRLHLNCAIPFPRWARTLC